MRIPVTHSSPTSVAKVAWRSGERNRLAAAMSRTTSSSE